MVNRPCALFNIMRTRLSTIALLAFLLLAAACGTTTKVTGSWRKPNSTANGYKNIFIAALSSNIPAKQAVESGLQAQLQQKGLTVKKSMDVFPPNFSTQTGQKRELILNTIQGSGADGILTIALLKKETQSRYTGGGGYWNPGLRYGYYSRFWSYYSNWYPSLYAPGYYTNDQVYYLETNLYDAKTEELIWAAQSETYNPSSIDSFLKGYVKSILNQMEKDGLITRQQQ
jgi:ABC-type glycerol-3-phosphate transport system substrate-binding protein